MSEYNNPVPVAVAMVPLFCPTAGRGLLGVVRGIEPGYGGIAFPGGYVDEHETIERAVVRELQEETGLHLPEVCRWRFRTSRVTPQNRLLFFFEYTDVLSWDEVRDNAVLDAETLAVSLILPDTDIVFPTHRTEAREFFGRQGALG